MAAARLRVATWNIRNAIGPGPFPDRWWSHIDADRLRAIGDFVGGLGADVVALQEVAVVSRDGELIDVPGALARQLGLHATFGAVRTFDVTDGDAVVGSGLFGNALLTPEPPGDARTVALPRAPDDDPVEPEGAEHPAAGVRWRETPPTLREPRCLVLGTFAGIRIGTAHLSHVGSGERLIQARAAVAAFDEATPAVLLGDLNAVAGVPALEPFAGWTDAFAEPPDDPARVSTDDGWAIDHVLSRGASARRARVVRDAGDLSDHYPVVAEVEVA